MNINWKKGFFSSKYELFSKNVKIGELTEKMFSNTSKGLLNNHKIEFKKKGLFNSQTDITDKELNKVIGGIKFNSWKSKAEINLNDKSYLLKSIGFWGNKWNLLENNEKIIDYKSSTLSGKIESKVNDQIILLIGLYTMNYYIRRTAIIAISTIIIIS
jgi:hypothetical protein